jgi:hypothetical protein
MTSHQPAAKEATVTRAKFFAWIVFITMAGTTMVFQCYHSIEYGHMPIGLALLFGIVPLFISIFVLEIVSEIKDNAPWAAKATAYLVVCGAMYLSASATSDVVFRASPTHMSGLFGVLMDAAALLASYVLLNGHQAASEDATSQPVARETGTPQATPMARQMASPDGTPQAAREAIPRSTGTPLNVPADEPFGVPSDVPAGPPPDVPADEPRHAPAPRPPARRPARAARAAARAETPMDPDSKRARKLYRESVEAVKRGERDRPLTDRALAEHFPGRGRTWAANRIAEAQEGPQLAAGASS